MRVVLNCWVVKSASAESQAVQRIGAFTGTRIGRPLFEVAFFFLNALEALVQRDRKEEDT